MLWKTISIDSENGIINVLAYFCNVIWPRCFPTNVIPLYKADDPYSFILSYEDTHLELVENAKYIGLFINSDLSWIFHVRRLYLHIMIYHY